MSQRLDLPQATDPRAHGLAGDQLLVELFVLAAEHGSRADEAHVALHHVEQLWHLVQARHAQDAAERGDARVVVRLEQRAVAQVEYFDLGPLLISVRHHRAQLVEVEGLTVATDALLAEEDRPAVLQLDDHRTHEHHGQGQQQQQRRGHDVEAALDGQLIGGQRRRLDVEERFVTDGERDDAPMADAPQAAGQVHVEPPLQERAQQPAQLGPIEHPGCHHDATGVVHAECAFDVVDGTEVRHRVRQPQLLRGRPDEAGDAVAELGMVGEQVVERERFGVGADDRDVATELALRAAVAQPRVEAATGDDEKEERDDATDREGQPRNRLTGETDDERRRQGHRETEPDEPAELAGAHRRHLRSVEAEPHDHDEATCDRSEHGGDRDRRLGTRAARDRHRQPGDGEREGVEEHQAEAEVAPSASRGREADVSCGGGRAERGRSDGDQRGDVSAPRPRVVVVARPRSSPRPGHRPECSASNAISERIQPLGVFGDERVNDAARWGRAVTAGYAAPRRARCGAPL